MHDDSTGENKPTYGVNIDSTPLGSGYGFIHNALSVTTLQDLTRNGYPVLAAFYMFRGIELYGIVTSLLSLYEF